MSDLSSSELERMKADLLLDIAEMEVTLAWINEELVAAIRREAERGYRRMEPEKIRDAVRELGSASAGDVAQALGISRSHARYKLNALYEGGTLIRSRIKGTIFYSIAKPQYRELRNVQTGERRLRVVGGAGAVPGTGRRAIAKKQRDKSKKQN